MVSKQQYYCLLQTFFGVCIIQQNFLLWHCDRPREKYIGLFFFLATNGHCAATGGGGAVLYICMLMKKKTLVITWAFYGQDLNHRRDMMDKLQQVRICEFINGLIMIITCCALLLLLLLLLLVVVIDLTTYMSCTAHCDYAISNDPKCKTRRMLKTPFSSSTSVFLGNVP